MALLLLAVTTACGAEPSLSVADEAPTTPTASPTRAAEPTPVAGSGSGAAQEPTDEPT